MADQREKLKKYESTIRSRVDCEEKAFHIVNRLIDGTVAGPYLIQCGKFISREHYKDVVEERAISHLCGYPLCSNSLVDIPKKQFHISTYANKVYDITERKNFCSNQCLKASKHFSNQISESPLWTRAKEPAADIKLIPHTGISGIIGDEVVGLPPKKFLEEEIRRLDQLDIGSSHSLKNSNGRPTSEKTNAQVVQDTKRATDSDLKLIMPAREEMKETSTDEDNTECNTDSIKSNIVTSLDRNNLEKEASLEHSTDSVKVKTQMYSDKMSISQEIGVENYSVCDKDETSNLSSYNTIGRNDESLLNQQKESLISNTPVTSKLSDSCRENYCETESRSVMAKSSHNQDLVKVKKCGEAEDQSCRIDHLMTLLSRRKGVLSGMIDLVTAESVHNSQSSQLLVPTDTVNSSPSDNTNNRESTLTAQGNDKQEQSNSSLKQSTPKAPVSKQGNKSTRKSKTVAKSPLEHIVSILKTWVTEETRLYLHSSSTDKSEVLLRFADPTVQKGYAEICQRLNTQQKDFEDLVSETCGSDLNPDNGSRVLKSVPDYSAIKKEAEEFQMKVTEFITGKKPELVSKKMEADKEREAVFIPTVDSYDQQLIRIKIVLERLDKVIPDLLAPLCLSVQDVSSLLRELVYTFRLEKDSIVFRPSEWTLVALFIIKMLGRKNKTLADVFNRESAAHYFTILLKGIGHTMMDLDRLTDDILRS